MIVVRVPTFIGLAEFIPNHGDEFDPGFEETACRETRLPEESHPVLITQRSRLGVDRERFADLWFGQEVNRPFPLARIALGSLRSCQFVPLLFQLGHQCRSSVKEIQFDGGGITCTKRESACWRDGAKRIAKWRCPLKLGTDRIERSSQKASKRARPFVGTGK